MNTKRFILAGCSIVVLSVSTAMAGPCDTTGRAANLKDAGSGPHRLVPARRQLPRLPIRRNTRQPAR